MVWIFIHDKEVNIIEECNLLHDILNPSKKTKNTNSHNSPIPNGWMNKQEGSANCKHFWILLDSGCISMIIMRSWREKIHPNSLWCNVTHQRVILLPI